MHTNKYKFIVYNCHFSVITNAFEFCKTLMSGGYFILAILVVKANSAKIAVHQYSIFDTFTSVHKYSFIKAPIKST